ncbi:MAG: hypothetical protein SCARUB_04219 [Candidatus Scalindua rubra]|uniref:Uncharacterized protein n=1 Tax=Candidatus Scalindua rubra TaxID=1872076 RepID=A0A1E3X4U3_9BACT|nr:MAG: hypothetical protein SCARUB_04219 [Candidatus Scalindua rubra]
MNRKLDTTIALKHIDVLERKLIRLKRDILHGLAVMKKSKKIKPSLFGSVRGGDVTEEMIEESKKNLFRKWVTSLE